tara:strand:+ start:18638 stop:20389 length:1752 start_codon:yes stop_codon:yes gene_type:complete
MGDILKFVKVFTLKFPAQFSLVLVAVFIQALANSVSVASIGPLAEVLLQTKPEDYSQITLMTANLFGYKELPVNFSFLLFGASLIFAGLISVVIQYMVFKTQFTILEQMMSETMGNFFNSKYEFFSETGMGQLLNSFQKESDKLGASFGSLTKLFVNFFQAIIFICIPFYISTQLTLIFLACLIFTVIPIWLINKKITPYGQLITSTANTLTSVLQENFTAAKLIMSFHRKDRAVDDYRKAFSEHARASVIFQSIIYATAILFMPLGMCAGLIAVSWGYKNGIEIASISMILFAFFRMMPVLGVLIQGRSEIKGFLPAFEQIERLNLRAKSLEHRDGTKEFNSFKEIKLVNLNFSYIGRANTLRDINLSIKHGDNIAIVGSSGSGKTTLTDILLGLYATSEGDFLLDGVNFNEYLIGSYRDKIGYVPQDPFLFNCSIYENFKWAKPDCSEEDIWEALESSNAKDFVKALPDGLDTSMGDRGSNLSGGQRQRIALARALIKKPLILILDEATSSLDNDSEKYIQQSINGLSKNITLITIAHRLSTIKNANKIFVLDQGEVLEHGSYQELADNKKSKFSEMLSQS